MAASDGGDPSWTGGGQWFGGRRRQPMWPGAARDAATGPRRWLVPLLWIVCGAVLGSIITIGLLVFAGPRPAPLPTQTGVGRVTVTVDDAYLTAAIRQAASGVPVVGGINALTAHSVPGDRILLTGSSSGFGGSTPVSMTLQPLAGKGVLSVRVLTARIGGMPLPAFLDTQLGNAIDAQIATLGQGALAGSHYAVTSVTTTSGHVILTLGTA